MSAAFAARASLLTLVGLFIPAVCFSADPPDRTVNDGIKVTIVAITASDKHENVHSKLNEIAKEVRKREPNLKGYQLSETACKPVAVGQKENFKLVDDQSADVTVLQKDDSNQRIRLAVKAPLVGEITYSTCYDKYFPIVTRYQTKTDRDRLIIAIMVKQAGKDKDVKEGKDAKPR